MSGNSLVKQSTGRGNVWYLDPNLIAVRDEARGRWKPVPEAAAVRMACSLLDDGQIQPVEVRRDGDELVLSLGFTRTLAGRMIRDGFTDDTGVHRRDKDFVLKVMLVTCTEQEAFVRNVVENAVRNQTSPVDDAFNMDRLRDRYGYDVAKLAQLYGRSKTSIKETLSLLTVEAKYQDLVHSGKMGVAAALELRKTPPADREAVLAAATKENGKISGAAVTRKARKLAEDRREAEAAAPPPETLPVGERTVYRPRTIGDLKMFLEEAEPVLPGDARALVKALREFVDGRRSEKGMIRALEDAVR